MYNLYQFTNKKQQQELEAKRVKQQEQYHLKHEGIYEKYEEYKKYAYQNLKKRSDQFLQRELYSNDPVIIEDDHFQSWRKHCIFRDVSDKDKFIGSKIFKHRPNQDMGKYYDQRERRQRSYLQEKKQTLVAKGLIPKQHLSRSVASQGPYNPKIQFRDRKKDEQYMQPRLRYKNITDQQRLSESQMLFDERLESIYQKFQQKKLKTGRQLKSGIYDMPSQPSYAVSSNSLRTTKSLANRKSSSKGIEQPQMEALSMSSSHVINSPKSKKKTFFKLAQMMKIFHSEDSKRQQISFLLERSQFSRKKDLTNIRSNSYNENYEKHPVL